MKRDDHQLVQQVLDGDIDREEFDRFQKRLREEPQLMDLYADYAKLHHTLGEEFEGGLAGAGAITVARRLPRVLAWVMAALLVIGLAWWLTRWPGVLGSREAAVVSFSLDAVWHFEGKTESRGGATVVPAGGKLQLIQGRARISPMPSVHAIIEAPAEMEFASDELLHLHSGRGFFELGHNGGNFLVTTPRLSAMNSGTRFGLQASSERADELHVISGVVRLIALESGEVQAISGGGAATVADGGNIAQMTIDGRFFPSGLGRFLPVVCGPLDELSWRISNGTPAIASDRIDGRNFAVFLHLPQPVPAENGGVLLVTMSVGKPSEGDFHTDGWAGMSLYSESRELLFFGDPFGIKEGWGLDVKQEIPVIMPSSPVIGPKIVTLRYDSHSGHVSLHEGTPPLAAPFCSGRIPSGTRIDEIRLGASAGAALAVHQLQIRSADD